MARITINGISVDPSRQFQALSARTMISPDSSNSDYIIIQTKQPLDKLQRRELEQLGVKILEYVPENAYIAYYPGTDLQRIRALSYVSWANEYLKGFKIEPALRPEAEGAKVLDLLSAPPSDGPMSTEPKTVEVVLHNNVSAETVRNEIAAAAGLDPAELKISNGKVRITVEPKRLDALSNVDGVRHIEEITRYKLCNNVASAILRADVVQSKTALEGEGEIVAVCDTGFDKGSLTDVHPAFSGRVAKLYPLGRKSASDPAGHGTHVCGSILGDGTSQQNGGAIRGTAPKAKLVVQSVLDSNGRLGGLPENLNDLFIVPYRDDSARVHSNSWGDRDGDGTYSQNSREVDEFVFNHRDCVICFAAGNDGADLSGSGTIAAGSVGAPSTAKNCITVGASENLRPTLTRTYADLDSSKFPTDPIASDLIADNPNGMAAFSSRGPTVDHRIKPDIIAPGCTILSTRSRLAAADPFWGVSNDPLYMFDAGTSMATPLVAGCAAVVREYFRKKHQLQPSAALVKAMLINGAQAMTGQYVPSETGSVPNRSEGFGRIDLAA